MRTFPQNVAVRECRQPGIGWHGLPAILLAIALVSCDALPGAQPKAPTGAIGAIAQAASALLAPGADITDMRFDEALEGADLQRALGSNADAIIAQVRKTRSAADAGWKPASASGGPRLASLAAVIGVFSVPLFAQVLASSLDELTKVSGTRPGRSNPVTSNDTSGGTFTTTTVNIVETISSSGSRVTASVSWSYKTASIDNASGQTVLTMTDERTMVGDIDVCPDGAGTVHATLNVQQNVQTNAKGTITTRQATSKNAFAGTVGDDANLRSVRQTFQEQSSWEMSTGTGSYDVTMSATYNAAQNGSFLGGMQVGSVTGNVASATGDAEGRLGRSVGFSVAVDALALDDAYKAAQRLWRNGRCVMVEAPTFGAKTPIEVGQQETKQHDEEVDIDSDTEFSVRLKHRFGGGDLTFPLRADLTSGEKKLEPNRLDSGSGNLKYKAPAEDEKRATAMLRTTSKRGIGTLVLEFHTGGGLTLTLTGELSGNDTSFATVRILDRLTIGPLEFKKTFGDLWEAQGKWRAETSSFTAALGETQTCTGSEGGDVTMMARVEKRGDRKVWVVDPLDSDATGTGSMTCEHSLGGTTLRGVTLPRTTTHDSDGNSAAIFIGILDTIVIPQEGGRVPVRGSQGTFTASGTATATTGN